MTTILQTHAARDFSCLGDACEDTCCKGWGMQLSQETVDLYKAQAPELMDAVTSSDAGFIMKRDAVSDYCVKFDQGWCGIHKQRGASFLGDACHFFPRVTRGVGDEVLMSIAPSCPEAARLMLTLDTPFARSLRDDARVPFSMKQYADEISGVQMLALHDEFMDDVAAAPSAAAAMAGIMQLAARLAMQPVAQWPSASTFYRKQIVLAAPEHHPADLLYVVSALMGLVKAGNAMHRPRLMQVITQMANAMALTLDWDALQAVPTDATAERLADMRAAWQGYYAGELDGPLKRYIQMQLSLNFFPFGGIGERIDSRALIIAVRFATVQLALMSYCMVEETVPDLPAQVRIIQSLSRFLDHLADPTLSLAIYHEVGWHREARLNALLGVGV